MAEATGLDGTSIRQRQSLSLHIDDDAGATKARRVSFSKIPTMRATPPTSPIKASRSDDVEAAPSESALLKMIMQGRAADAIDVVEIGLSVSEQPKPAWRLKSLCTLSPLIYLVSLDVSGHGIYSMDGLEAFGRLVHLKMARNNLKAIKVPRLPHLETLDLSGNYITQIPKPIQALTHLQALDLSGNGLTVLKQVELLAPLLNLQSLHLTANPMAMLHSYREFVVFTLLALATLDEQPITVEMRERSRRRFTGPLSDDEQRRAADKLLQQEQSECVQPRRSTHTTTMDGRRLEAKQDVLEAENLRLKSELHVKSQLLENKSKEWSSATHQLLQMQQELAMIHIDKNHPGSPLHLRYTALQNHMNLHLGTPTEAPSGGEAIPDDTDDEQPAKDALRLVHKVSMLQQTQATLRTESHELEKELVAIRNEIAILDNDINVLKQSLLGDQHASVGNETGGPATYYYDDGQARLDELQTQIAFADVETQELERRLVLKTKDMLAADLRYPEPGTLTSPSEKRFSVFDKEISALSYKLERMTTQKAEWVDELHKLQSSKQLPVLRLKENPRSPRESIRQSFRQAGETNAAPPPETKYFRLLVTEKLDKLQQIQLRRLDLVDTLMTREASYQAIHDHLARIDAELFELQLHPIGTAESLVAPTDEQAANSPTAFALSTPQTILEQLKTHVLDHVTHALGVHGDERSPPRSPARSSFRIKLQENDTTSPPRHNAAATPDSLLYQSQFELVPGVQLTSPNYALLSRSSGLTLDANTRLMLACKKLQQARDTFHVDRVTNMDMDPQTQRLLSRLEVTVMAAVNLPRTRRLYSSCDPYAVLHLEQQHGESGAWERVSELSTARSTTKPNTLFPVWDEDFAFKPIETMSTRLCLTLLDDKKSTNRHDVLGEVKVELRTLWDQKRTVLWYNLTPSPVRDRPQPAVRLRLRFLYNRVDRLRRIVDRLVADYVGERHQLPPYLYNTSDEPPCSPPTEEVDPIAPSTNKPNPPAPLQLDIYLEKQDAAQIHPLSPVREPTTMDTYKEIFLARRRYRKVKGKRIAGCFDSDSPYHPKHVAEATKAKKPPSVNTKLFKQPTWVPRDTTQAIPERYFGLTTDKSERLKQMFGKLETNGRRNGGHQAGTFPCRKPCRKTTVS
ncbi:Aste57867_934 [Aphanomyces stellatus]|uniref:Aste57867_934 protein n=1 Tax=Aphanomyces stellatus TaxID=120398 RepID=A0A485K961_9STRA|nr:hypothetical protein As57867_000933 [Aphanomyces stellatus]VFT78157.1 Aste57867_934 [Aphanomyces stellatus]